MLMDPIDADESLDEGPRRAATWRHDMRRYQVDLALTDGVAVSFAAAMAYVVRFGFDGASLDLWAESVPYGLLSVVFVPLWVGALYLAGAYEAMEVGYGSEEYRRIIDLGFRAIATAAILAYALQVDVARGFIASLLPLTTAWTLLGRRWSRGWLRRQRDAGRATRSLVLVGSQAEVEALAAHLGRERAAGYVVIGSVLSTGPDELPAERILDDAMMLRPDGLAIAGGSGTSPATVRSLARGLEGSGVEMVVAPSLVELAGPRIVARPTAGLPLLHVREPRLGGGARVFKGVVDAAVGALLLVALSPVILGIALAVRLTTRGPVIFRQERVGWDGHHFQILKFRTMEIEAEGHLPNLAERNEAAGPLFKMRRDPRVTSIGRILRRFSLDELPQLVNVVRGQMSLVGPRPPLPDEVLRYEPGVERRLMARPGITGLWQVSGRSDLPWDEAVRLDIYYVENWSPALDLTILLKTVGAVLRGSGAY